MDSDSSSQSSQDSQLEDMEKVSRKTIASVMGLYDQVLRANQMLDKKYQDQEIALYNKLVQIRAEMSRKEDPEEPPKEDTFRYYTVGRPYFKDENFEAPPDNDDAVVMKECEMYDFSGVMTVAGWTVGDKTRLLNVLGDLAKDYIKMKIYEEISQLQLKPIKSAACLTKIENLKQELYDLRFKELYDLPMPEKLVFDWKDVALKLNMRHSPEEYKAIWELLFHPKVNKKTWTQFEHIKLQRIVSEKGMQDWEAIAKELDTNRTGYQCFVYYRTNVSHAANGRKWSQNEVKSLERLIKLYKEQDYIPWGRVAASMPNRTKIQCYNKYLRLVEKRKGRFLPEEDAVILNFVSKYGPDFRQMSKVLTSRSTVQLRVRYQLLTKVQVSTTWTVEDDRKLLQIMAHQDSTSNFSDATLHFPGKDRQNIRSRYNTLMKWMKSHPHSDVSTAPRRGARRLAHGEPDDSLQAALSGLHSRMWTDQRAPHRRRKLKFTRSVSHNVIHDAIMSTIANLDANAEVAQQNEEEEEIADVASSPDEQMNLFNIKYFLIALNTKVANEKTFYNSVIGQKFKALEDVEPPNMGMMKSYSKRGKLTSIRPVNQPDLFRNAAGRRFLLPPNFATLTASKVILNYQGFFNERSAINWKTMARRNISFKNAMTKLTERFLDVFTWPYMLSNKPPEMFNIPDVKARQVKKSGYKPLPSVPAVTIPPPPPKRLRLQEDVKGIDLSSHDADIDISPDFNVL